MSERSEKAKGYFLEGYNCSQAVFGAFADKFGFDKDTAMKLSCGLGGGCGRQRELCGAISGGTMVLSMKYGSSDASPEGKKLCYEKIRAYCDEFRKDNPSIVCKELLGLTKAEKSAAPEERNENYYKKRPCAEIVELSALAVEKILNEE